MTAPVPHEAVQAMSARKPRIVNPPERIWLHYGDLSGEFADLDHNDCEEVTWCHEAIEQTDVEYRLVRPSKHTKRTP